MDRNSFEIYKATQKQLLVSRFVLRVALRKPQVSKLASIKRIQETGDAATWLADRLRVSFPGNAEIMEVSLSCDDPKEAATLVNAVVDAYMSDVVNLELMQKRQRLDQLEDACNQIEKQVRDKREEIKKTADEVGASETEVLSMKQKLALEELSTFRQQVSNVNVELRRLGRELAGQKAILQDAKAEERPTILQAIKRLQTERDVGSEQQKKLQSEIEMKQREAEKFGNSNVVIEMMRNDIKNSIATLEKIATQRDELRLEIRAPSRVTLLQRAEVPEK